MDSKLNVSSADIALVSDTVKVVKGEKFTTPYPLGEIPKILIGQEPYMLSLASYQILKSNDIRSKLITAAVWLIGPTLTFGLTLLAKLPRNAADIKLWECIAFGLGILISLVLFLVGRKKPNPKKALLSIIEKHFEENKEHLWVDQKHE